MLALSISSDFHVGHGARAGVARSKHTIAARRAPGLKTEPASTSAAPEPTVAVTPFFHGMMLSIVLAFRMV